MEPEGALTVSGVMSNARGVVMVRWVRKTNPMMIKQFIYMYLQRRISASDSKHVMSSVTIRTPAVSERTLSGPIKHGEPLFTATESKLSPNTTAMRIRALGLYTSLG